MNTPSVTVELFRIALLLFMFLGYVAICAWAFAPRNRERFEAAARIPLQPLQNGEAPPATSRTERIERIERTEGAGQSERPA